MNLTELAEIIKSPAEITGNQISSIKDLAERHPYAQIFTLLYLEGLSKTKDVNFESELNRYAFQITDREQLFNLIHLSEINIEVGKDTAIKSEAISEEKPIEAENNIVEETLSENDNYTVFDEQVKSEEEEEVLSKESTNLNNPEELAVLHTPAEVQEQIPDADIPTFDPLELDIIATAVSNTIEMEVIQEMDKSPEIEITIDSTSDVEAIQKEPSTKSFIDWLKENNKPIVDKKKDSFKQNIDAILEKFIAEEPKISKPKKEFFSPSKIAKQSLEESTLPVSETLAKIFAIQGNFPKAISAYHTLMLKYPEKKVFFADQIKELEQKLNK